jgi:MFS family permease
MSQRAAQVLSRSGRLPAFLLLCLGVWLYAADSLLVATTMPEAVQQIGGLDFINWTVSLYLLASIVASAAAPRLIRRMGLRRALIGGAACYGIGCATSALAPDMGVMLLARLAQGVGGGLMLSLSYVAIQRLFPAHLWTRLLAIHAGVWGASSPCGPLIGGLFTQALLWRDAFWAFAVQAALLCLLAVTRLHGLSEDRPASAADRTGDSPWRPLLALSIATLAISAAGVSAPALAVVLAAAGLILLGLAGWLDVGAQVRLMPHGALHSAHPIGAGLLMVLCLSAGTTAFVTYGPVLLEALAGSSALFVGYLVAGESLAWTLGTLAVAKARSARLIIRCGVALILVGGCTLALAVPPAVMPAIILGVVAQGVGFGMLWPHLTQRIVIAARSDERDVAAACASTVSRIGGAIGSAANGIAANGAGLAGGATAAHSYQAAIWVFGTSIPLLLIGYAAARRI